MCTAALAAQEVQLKIAFLVSFHARSWMSLGCDDAIDYTSPKFGREHDQVGAWARARSVRDFDMT